MGSPKPGLDWTTNSILCTPNEPSSTGMLEKVWKKVNSLKPEKIWPLWRRITKRSESTPSKANKKKKMNSKSNLNLVFRRRSRKKIQGPKKKTKPKKKKKKKKKK